MDLDEWQEMPVVQSRRQRQAVSAFASDSSSDSESGPSNKRIGLVGQQRHGKLSSVGNVALFQPMAHASTNATGRSLNIDDSRGYDWRSKPAGAPGMHTSMRDEAEPAGGGYRARRNGDFDEDSNEELDEEKGKGYTQLRLDEDVEGDELHAATEYLFGDSQSPLGSRGPVESSVGYSYQGESDLTPLSQISTTKSLLSEPQKIAYVGLCALKAKEMVRVVRRIPGSSKELATSLRSMEEWELRVMARLFQHMDIDASGESESERNVSPI